MKSADIYRACPAFRGTTVRGDGLIDEQWERHPAAITITLCPWKPWERIGGWKAMAHNLLRGRSMV